MLLVGIPRNPPKNWKVGQSFLPPLPVMDISDIVSIVDDASLATSKLRSNASGGKQELNEKGERAGEKFDKAVSFKRKPTYFPSLSAGELVVQGRNVAGDTDLDYTGRLCSRQEPKGRAKSYSVSQGRS